MNSLKDSIRSIQSKARGSIVRSLSFLRNSEYLNSSPSITSAGDTKDLIVLEPMDLIFTIRAKEIEDLDPSLIIENKGEDGNLSPHFLYLNKFALSFLHFICQSFDVIIYSRLKTAILNHILGALK